MRRLSILLVVFWAWAVDPSAGCQAGEYRLSNGNVYAGEAASFDDEGLVVRLDIGGFSPRISWNRLTQETLKELAKNPQAARFVEPFIELTFEQIQEKKEKKEIVIRDVPRLERPEKTGFFAALPTPAGLMIVIVFYLANLFAAYEIAVYRQKPAALVCGVSAIAPVLGPIIFLAAPSEHSPMAPAHDGSAPDSGEALVGNPLATAKQTGPAPSALGIAAAAGEKKPKETLEGAVFKRGETTFNRRFIETKFAGFFRVVPGEAEKDLVVVVRTARKELVARRISRISSNEMHVQLISGASEASVPFAEITEMLVRRKDAKG